MNSAYLTFLTLLLHTAVFAQSQLKVHAEVRSGSNGIEDGLIYLRVDGGIPPYQYKWSDRDIPLDADKATALTEGTHYGVVVTDAAGNAVKSRFKVPARSISEHLNGMATLAKRAIEKVLFFDPFAALGIYDPVFYADAQKTQPLLYPNGDVRKKNASFIAIWLVVCALFLTIKMGFIPIRKFIHSIQLAFKRSFREPDALGKVTHFQALSAALSSTVGLGNVAGVAAAISVGGPGAMFWIWVSGFFGMAVKFVSCSLSIKYREIRKDGYILGGPMAYLSRGLQRRKLKGLGKFLAASFAVFAIIGAFGSSNLFSCNQSSIFLQQTFPILKGRGLWIGVIFGIAMGVILIGRVKRLVRVTEKVVPFMCIGYVLIALIVISLNMTKIGEAFGLIVHNAFNPGVLKGGMLGVLILGIRRGAFSNEAGVGTAPIAHSETQTNHPISVGFVASIGPFIDSILICTLTALTLILTNHYRIQGLGGVELTAAAIKSQIGEVGDYLLIPIVLLLGLSTALTWGYYAIKSSLYLFGANRKIEVLFCVLYGIFAVVGASASLGAIIYLIDFFVLIMAFPNILGLYILSGEVRSDLSAYLKRLKNDGLSHKGS